MWSDGNSFLPRLKIVQDATMVTTSPRQLDRWERFRVWVENLADRAGVYYHFPRVRRTETKPSTQVIRMGDTLICHPVIARAIRDWTTVP